MRLSPCAAASGDDLDERIAALEVELAALRREKAARRDAVFLLALARVIPAGVVFSAADVLARAALDRELAQAIGTRTARQLGHYLRALAARPHYRHRSVSAVASSLVLRREDDRNNRGCIWSITITP